MKSRYTKKLLAQSSWDRGAKDRPADHHQWSGEGKKGNKGERGLEQRVGEPQTVFFTKQTAIGELGRRLRELLTR